MTGPEPVIYRQKSSLTLLTMCQDRSLAGRAHLGFGLLPNSMLAVETSLHNSVEGWELGGSMFGRKKTAHRDPENPPDENKKPTAFSA